MCAFEFSSAVIGYDKLSASDRQFLDSMFEQATAVAPEPKKAKALDGSAAPTAKKAPKKPKDPDAPKKPPSAYIAWCQEERKSGKYALLCARSKTVDSSS